MATTSSDIVERAETALKDAGTYWQPAAFGAGCLTLMPELIAEVKRLRKLHAPIGGFGGMYSGGSDV